MSNCGFKNCNNKITRTDSGAKIGYQINNLNRELVACTPCAMKLMSAPRGTFYVTKHKELKPNNQRIIIT